MLIVVASLPSWSDSCTSHLCSLANPLMLIRQSVSFSFITIFTCFIFISKSSIGGRTSAVLAYNFAKFFFGVCVEGYPQKTLAHWHFPPVVIHHHTAIHWLAGVEVAHHNGLPHGVVAVLYLCSCLKLHAYRLPWGVGHWLSHHLNK
jgi:hypothetical protein